MPMAFGRTADWREGRDERALRGSLWKKLGRFAVLLPFTEDLLTAYYCAFDRETPYAVRGALLAALAYFVVPADAIPDIVPALGFTDDAAVLAATFKCVSGHIKPVHRDAARTKLAWLRPVKGEG
jgi:uncharacterized membrane protein YkvA (DUF1232 family)